jgi:hypothetical protein
MPVYIEIHGIEPEDLELDQRTGENRHDHIALANLVYGALKNHELPNDRYHYESEKLARQLSDTLEQVTGVGTVANPDMHEKITGRRPDYDD